MRNEPAQAGGAVLGASEERMLESVGPGRSSWTGRPPSPEPAAVGVDDERNVDESHPSRHIGKVGHPQPIWRRGIEAAIHQIRVSPMSVVGDGGRPARSRSSSGYLLTRPITRILPRSGVSGKAGTGHCAGRVHLDTRLLGRFDRPVVGGCLIPTARHSWSRNKSASSLDTM